MVEHVAQGVEPLLPKVASFVSKGVLALLLIVLLGLLLWKVCLIGRFYIHLKGHMTAQNYTEALKAYKQLEEVPFNELMFVENRAYLMAQLQDWKGVLNVTADAILGLHKHNYVLWYYKGFAEFMLGMDDESEKSLYESNYLQ
jgi:hypothetical protein